MTVASAGPGLSTTAEALRLREWQLGPGRPTLVMDQFSAEDFSLIVDDRSAKRRTVSASPATGRRS
ncbi:hypothetical protein A6A06_15450 [Streptomyces sp. CB02923]|nr:hypothetical protein A6A06_15450 [Streptomyces sp. CB02923]